MAHDQTHDPRRAGERPWKAKQAAAKARAERQRKMTIGVVSARRWSWSSASSPRWRCQRREAARQPTPTARRTAPTKAAFRLPGLLDDTTVSLADFAGTPVVVNFFASWCVYCNEELPGFVQVAKATGGTVDFVGVNTSDPGDGAAMARRFDLAGAGFALAKDIGGNPPRSCGRRSAPRACPSRRSTTPPASSWTSPAAC